MILSKTGSNLFKPFTKLLRRGAVRQSTKVGSKSGAVAGATAKSSGGVAAKTVAANIAAFDLLEDEYREEPPSGLEAAMFKQLPRPRLIEKSASDLTLEEAQNTATQAKRFYEFKFPLFSGGELFYEEIEDQYLSAALGAGEGSIDERFIDVATLFRRTLNANTRRLLLYWAPLIGFIVFVGAAIAQWTGVAFASFFSDIAQAGLIYGAAALIAAFLVFVIYSWPYKVVQQRNLMNLDNYVTSKFARINNNFQVAKRRALNVERDKRMAEREALKDEAGAWTLAYHWFATRLFLCETMLRNKFYQVRRNTTLYWLAGLLLTFVLLSGLGIGFAMLGAGAEMLAVFGAAALFYIVLAGAVVARAAGMMFKVLQSNEWSRFHLVNLNHTIRDHVGEDKLQIVTFRDRNRFE